MIVPKPGFFVAVVRRLPGGRGIKAPKDSSLQNVARLTCFPTDTCLANLRSYYHYWPSRRTSFINYGFTSSQSQTAHFTQNGCAFYTTSSKVVGYNSDDPSCTDEGGDLHSLYGPGASAECIGTASINQSNKATEGSEASWLQTRPKYHQVPVALSSSMSGKNEEETLGSSARVGEDGPNLQSPINKPLKKFTILSLSNKYKEQIPITMVTAYDYPTAQIVDEAGTDIILVGDSVAMVVLGHPNTVQVTMDQMIHHSKAVASGSKRALLVGDLPFGSYLTVEHALFNASRFIKEAGMDAVKLEGGCRVLPQVRAIVDAGIAVIGHIGLTPQSQSKLGGFTVQGKTPEGAQKIIDDAIALEKAGVSAIVLEMIPAELARKITESLNIPTIGIGAGVDCSGQVLVFHDICGMYDKFQPKFCKQYSNIRKAALQAVREYNDEVRTRVFPSKENSFWAPEPKAAKTTMLARPSNQQKINRVHTPTILSCQPFLTMGLRMKHTHSAPKSAESLVVIGGGGIGTFLAARLSKNFRVYLFSKSQQQILRENGGTITLTNLKDGGKTKCIVDPLLEDFDTSFNGTIDTVVVAVKSRDTKNSIAIAKKLLRLNGKILFVQNGIGFDDVVRTELKDRPDISLTYGVTSIGAHVEEPGIIRQTGDGSTLLISPDKKFDDSAERFQLLLEQSGVESEVFSSEQGDWIKPLWNKLLVNSVINPLASLFGVFNGQLLKNPAYNRIVAKLIQEIATAIPILGIPTDYATEETLREQVYKTIQKTKENTNSMTKDIQRDRETEIAQINGKLLEVATKNHYALPINSALITIFSAMRPGGKNKEDLKILRTLEEFRKYRNSLGDEIVGFVPTMGALHEGHTTLIKSARAQSSIVIVSIFVNPTQFAAHEDLDRYPRPIAKDVEMLKAAGVDALFLPSVKDMYPRPQSIFVKPIAIDAASAEAAARPQFFTGVATVCTKLFNIVQPHHAFFGQKDAVQAIVIRNMVQELNFPLRVVIVDTVRDEDGLAMSSRNLYLSPEERKNAPIIHKALQRALSKFKEGTYEVGVLKDTVLETLLSCQFPQLKVEYVSLADGESASELKDSDKVNSAQSSSPALLSVAVKLGNTRLIDNVLLL